MQATAASLGFTVGRNPVFDAICEKEAANAVVNAHALLAQTPEEAFKQASKSFKGLRVPHDLKARMQAKPMPQRRTLMDVPIPRKFDLRELGTVPPIRNQASCGSCYDFSAVATAESAYLAANGGDPSKIDWSEQAVIDCGGTGGCRGDWPETVLEILKTRGTCDESSDRYRADDGNGRCPSAKPNKIDDYHYIGTSDAVPSVDAIKRAMFERKTIVSCAIVFDDYASAYGGGVFKNTNNNPNAIDHAIDLFGWDDDQGCWLLRNHWDKNWGEGGTMRIAYGANLVGFGAIIAVVNGNAPVPVPPVPPSPPTPVPPVPPVPVPPVPQGYDLALDPITFHTPTFGGNVTINPTGKIVPKKSTAAPLQMSVNWFSLLLDIRKLVSDAKGVDFAAAIAAVKQIAADVKARDFAAAVSDFAALEAAVASANWPVLLEDLKKVAADFGIAL